MNYIFFLFWEGKQREAINVVSHDLCAQVAPLDLQTLT